jgi:hypothetical protein
MKRTPLKSDPKKVEEWRRRSAKKAWKARKTALKRTPLKKRSTKMEKEMAGYRVERDIFLSEHPQCEYRTDNYRCCNLSRDIHHMQGRGPNLRRQETWMAICRRHHDWIHDNANKARELGFLK